MKPKRGAVVVNQMPGPFQPTDVFLKIICSECDALLVTFRGHASAFQQAMFPVMKQHRTQCLKIAKLTDPTNRLGRPS